MLNPNLAPYQLDGACWLNIEPHRILADEMGLGKSFQCISAADMVNARSILIVCPGIVRQNWVEEFKKWSTIPRSVKAVTSSSDKLISDVLVISYSLLRSIKVLRVLLSRKWDILILDECHAAKNPGSWRTRALYGMKCDGKNGLVSVSKKVFILSGTLMPNSPAELWSHCNALFPDVANNMGYARWIQEYCVTNPMTKRIVRGKNTEKLAQLLRPHVLRRLSEDVLPQLPPLRFSHVPIHPENLPPMSSEIAETAKVVNAAIEQMSRKETAEKGKAAFAKIDLGHVAALRKWTGIAKAPGVAEYVNLDFASGMDKVVIFASHREPIAYFENAIAGSAAIHGGISQKKRDEIIAEFRFGNGIKALVAQIELANAGIQLVSACNAVFAESPWTPHTVQQAIARLHRQGQTRPVFARLFSLSGSFDETVVRTMERKLRLTRAFNASIKSE